MTNSDAAFRISNMFDVAGALVQTQQAVKDGNYNYTDNEADLIIASVEALARVANVKTIASRMTGMEAWNSKRTSSAARRIGLEGIGDTLSEVWKKIKEMFISLFDKFKSFFTSNKSSTEKHVKSIEEKVEKFENVVKNNQEADPRLTKAINETLEETAKTIKSTDDKQERLNNTVDELQKSIEKQHIDAIGQKNIVDEVENLAKEIMKKMDGRADYVILATQENCTFSDVLADIVRFSRSSEVIDPVQIQKVSACASEIAKELSDRRLNKQTVLSSTDVITDQHLTSAKFQHKQRSTGYHCAPDARYENGTDIFEIGAGGGAIRISMALLRTSVSLHSDADGQSESEIKYTELDCTVENTTTNYGMPPPSTGDLGLHATVMSLKKYTENLNKAMQSMDDLANTERFILRQMDEFNPDDVNSVDSIKNMRVMFKIVTGLISGYRTLATVIRRYLSYFEIAIDWLTPIEI